MVVEIVHANGETGDHERKTGGPEGAAKAVRVARHGTRETHGYRDGGEKQREVGEEEACGGWLWG